MNEPQEPKPHFWPMLFITAFAVGGVLWVLWMTKIIQQTRDSRVKDFFVPMSTNILPVNGPYSNSIPTNAPVAQTNSATSGATNPP